MKKVILGIVAAAAVFSTVAEAQACKPRCDRDIDGTLQVVDLPAAPVATEASFQLADVQQLLAAPAADMGVAQRRYLKPCRPDCPPSVNRYRVVKVPGDCTPFCFTLERVERDGMEPGPCKRCYILVDESECMGDCEYSITITDGSLDFADLEYGEPCKPDCPSVEVASCAPQC